MPIEIDFRFGPEYANMVVRTNVSEKRRPQFGHVFQRGCGGDKNVQKRAKRLVRGNNGFRGRFARIFNDFEQNYVGRVEMGVKLVAGEIIRVLNAKKELQNRVVFEKKQNGGDPGLYGGKRKR